MVDNSSSENASRNSEVIRQGTETEGESSRVRCIHLLHARTVSSAHCFGAPTLGRGNAGKKNSDEQR